MAVAKDLKVLVISEEMVRTGEGELFHCLAGLDRVWHADLANALEMFAETAEDGWDAVIINSGSIQHSASVAKGLNKCRPEQEIIVLYGGFSQVEDCDFAIGVPRDAQALRTVLRNLLGLAA